MAKQKSIKSNMLMSIILTASSYMLSLIIYNYADWNLGIIGTGKEFDKVVVLNEGINRLKIFRGFHT